ncbi:hypothetical protein [Haliangium sp.]|uniref:hypothetical protein n=1 Tax=Haliangium sp. TaxID=2663208 RepID=UPI003D12FE46
MSKPMPPIPADLPPASFTEVPGWLGFSVHPAEARQQPWSPSHPNAGVVILGADAWSESVEEGRAFRLVAREGNRALTLSEVSQIPYGCDGVPTTMAAFKLPLDLAEQAVWILPDGFTAAEAVAVTAGERGPERRTWSAGALAIEVRKAGADAGAVVVSRGDHELYRGSFEKPQMDGAPDEPWRFDHDLPLGVPMPVAAFRIEGGLTVLVLGAPSYEGVSFEVLAGRDQLASAGSQYVYLCAY